MELRVVGDSGALHTPFPLEKKEDWRLKICGEVEEEKIFSLQDLKKFPQTSVDLEIHCVSVGQILGRKGRAHFQGVLVRDLMDQVSLKREFQGNPLAKTIGFFSKAPGACGPRNEAHHTYLSLDYALSSPHLLVTDNINGQPLLYQNGGPLRTVVGADLFFYKSVKWLCEIRLLKSPLEECLGTWEKYAGYHNLARVAYQERFSPFFRLQKKEEGGVSQEAVDKDLWEKVFLEHYKKKDLSSLVVAQIHDVFPLPQDYSRCFFSSPPHSGQFRGVNFKQAIFYGAHLEGANFSLSKFPSAHFSRGGEEPASLVGGDFEGAIFIGAHLENVSMEGAFLAGAKFYPEGSKKKKAFVKGLLIKGVQGLDLQQKEWLLEDGAVEFV